MLALNSRSAYRLRAAMVGMFSWSGRFKVIVAIRVARILLVENDLFGRWDIDVGHVTAPCR